ncbi:hypothetical protein EGW08_009022 [Elysia chlorotica]|uniref:galactosylceramidase n=1 Tax=Elysia chlorotica TaxID=188477 RepID=A0A433TNU0_ELYCH|nr:hypothetical protein EGW08_009022 [Elysia chlorotica]
MVSSHTVTAVVFLHCLVFVFALKSKVLYFKVSDFLKDEQNTLSFDDSNGLGRVFEGIGAISGGGATSKLLVNYPKTQRDEILDYLFKPGFGASLQIFKVEIGGDIQSTDGTEASHMHNSWEENYHRGYEWWLMQEAKKRNPDIKLYCLPWGFPGWLGKGTQNPYIDPVQTANYVVNWIKGAKYVYNLTIDYVGVSCNVALNREFSLLLRMMVMNNNNDENGAVVVVAVVDDVAVVVSLVVVAVVLLLLAHYPGTKSTNEAQQSNKPLWASEDYSTFNDEVGGGCWARCLSSLSVSVLHARTISWNLIGSYYPSLPFPRNGLMTAMEPWSGHYVVSTPIWVSAHTTQFVPVGWTYLQHNHGVGKLPKGGSYVSLTNEAKDHLTIVIETMTHDHSICVRPELDPYQVSPQTVTISLQGSFVSMGIVNIMILISDLVIFYNVHTIMFKELFTNGQAQLYIGLDEVYTLTTINRGKKGTHPKPEGSAPFPSYIKDDFSAYEENQEPFYLAPQIGSYEVRKVGGHSVVRQTVLQRPVYWCPAETADKTISIIGSYNWTQTNISVEFEVPAVNGTDGVFVAARVDRGGCDTSNAQGVFFFVFPTTGKFMVTNDLARSKVLHQGSVPMGPGKHQMSLGVTESTAEGYYDLKQTFSIDLPATPTNGWAALGTDSFGLADFYSYTLRSS